ncbi:NAD(P)-binding protein [Decorospora gaudefroyi]|uniref:NAD(P)-binding protein n=1 Tax=Decorospora gaudefroyi TaxID=184978 RepID=A0A6A5KNL6_9PLEO|nr:NAD(P)-binding protein [Decorospora gaudefroyi]
MALDDKTIVLITGANSGIGFSLATQLLASPTYHILLGSRSPTKGTTALTSLLALNLPGTVSYLPLDVTSPSSILSAAETVRNEYGHLDALVNNAGIDGERMASSDGGGGASSLHERMRETFATNTIGPALVVEAFIGLMSEKEGRVARIVNVTSGAGSIRERYTPEAPKAHQEMGFIPYRTSKAALNMLTVCQAYEYGPLGIKVFCFCPGFTASGLGVLNTVENGAQPTSKGAEPMVGILEGERDEQHGGFLNGMGGLWDW